MTIISGMNSNGTNWTRTVQVICPWIRKFAIFDFVYILASANIDQSLPNLATTYMPIRSRMSSIMGQIEPEHQGYLPLNLEKLLNMTVYPLSSTNIDQSAPNLVKMYVIIRSPMSSIMDLIGPELSKLSALELENLPYLTLFVLLHLQILNTLLHLQILNNQYQTRPQYVCP